ncbi:hypothetical protein Halru_2710 [Halovivax ruber XH-70]|uniref:VOC domain-containing protein n=1 Tax=Halovivax ruber (strain DSM 18193 / JCM 13892 / XH-70) TaxID=797302 RepID=L0ICM4_HALRX|nr:hypothetical protein [Halovivax ruber]AGB17285.1 hypothetical protein Halru_2710 [Halovivax ruber XH-70]
MALTERLFHLHFQVPDVSHAAAALADQGVEPHRRYGRVDDESRSIPAGEPQPDGFRLRLQGAQLGTANVTLAPGPGLEFDHFGVIVPDFETVLQRARDCGWHVNVGTNRTFLHTPWGFRIEVQPTDGPVASSLDSPTDGHFSSIVLAVPEPESVRDELDAVLGEVSALELDRSGSNRPSVPQLTLAGASLPGERTILTRDLEPADS